jgi:hypothetical protein
MCPWVQWSTHPRMHMVGEPTMCMRVAGLAWSTQRGDSRAGVEHPAGKVHCIQRGCAVEHAQP